MKPKRSKVVLIREPTLFELDKLEQAANVVKVSIERPYSEPGLLLGTSAFTANGWSGSLYPPGLQSRDFLSHYAAKFETVEIDTLTPQAVPLR